MPQPERIVPDETEAGIVALHAARYEFACAWCDDREVLDAACGVGYGSALLAARARRVVGIDLSDDAIAYARLHYAGDGIEFRQMDVQTLDFGDELFDVVCSFETLEHLDDPAAAVGEFARVLRPGGTLVASTPQAEVTTHEPTNPFHRVELSAADFESLLRHHFDSVEIYGQRRPQTRRHRVLQRFDVLGLRRRLPVVRRLSRRITGTSSIAELGVEDVAITRGSLDGASEVLAVCRHPCRR
jgi:SAM-dependent methyltransferase